MDGTIQAFIFRDDYRTQKSLHELCKLVRNQESILNDIKSIERNFKQFPLEAIFKLEEQLDEHLEEFRHHRDIIVNLEIEVADDTNELSSLSKVPALKVEKVIDILVPDMLVCWLSDRYADIGYKFWWQTLPMAGTQVSEVSLMLYRILAKLPNIPEISDVELKQVSEALKQLYVTDAIQNWLDDRNKLRKKCLLNLLKEKGFQYFSAGWTEVGSGHAMIAMIEPQTNQEMKKKRYSVTLFNSGYGIDSYHHHRKDGLEFSSHVRLVDVSIKDLKRVNFFLVSAKSAKEAVEKLYTTFPESYEVIDPKDDYNWFRGQLSDTCCFTVIRLLLRYILKSNVKARLLRYEITKEMVSLIRQHSNYDLIPKFWQEFVQRVNDHAPAKLKRQLEEATTPSDIAMMRRVMEIHHGLSLETLFSKREQ